MRAQGLVGQIFSLGLVRGVIAGLIGTGVGVGITMVVRWAMGMPAWKEGPVLTIGILVGVVAYLIGLGAFKYWGGWVAGISPKEKPAQPSWTRYFNFDTNHKIIGIQYLMTSLIFLLFAGALQLIGRLEMSLPGRTIIGPATYNSLIGDHGIIMLLIVALSGISGVMNYLLPLLIGARDMAFPRLNALSYWLVPPAGLLMVFSLLAGGFDTGWTAYPPLSVRAPLGMNLILLGVFINGFSSILGAVNILTTIFKLRAPGMSLFRMPIFVWASLATTILSLGFTQFVAIAFLLVLFERLLGMGFFQPEMGGKVLLYQHLFWFYSHPAVYIFVLPGLGIISEILPVFSRKPLFGYKAVALSSLGISLGGTIVWGHHMFAAGMEGWLRIPFMVTTVLVAVPTGVKIFSWLATMWLGKLRMDTPLLFVLSAIVFFLIGGLTGVPQGIVPVDLYLHDTYWVVAHFHATLFGGFLFPLMAALYYWFPKVKGRMLGERLGKFQWGLMTLGFSLLDLPMFGLGLMGMRRRVADYDASLGFQPFHVVTAVGGFLIALGLLVLVYNLVVSARRGVIAGANPWGARTLEWQISSPPPEENFSVQPRVVASPYGYGSPGSVHAVWPPAGGREQKESVG